MTTSLGDEDVVDAAEESGTPDGINNLALAFAKGNGVVYNLQGQRTDGLQKGLNIVDGKKVWVK